MTAADSDANDGRSRRVHERIGLTTAMAFHFLSDSLEPPKEGFPFNDEFEQRAIALMHQRRLSTTDWPRWLEAELRAATPPPAARLLLPYLFAAMASHEERLLVYATVDHFGIEELFPVLVGRIWFESRIFVEGGPASDYPLKSLLSVLHGSKDGVWFDARFADIADARSGLTELLSFLARQPERDPDYVLRGLAERVLARLPLVDPSGSPPGGGGP